MPATLTVRYSRSEPVHGSVLSYGLSAEVINAEGMPRKIFVIKRLAPSATDPELDGSDFVDEFSHVADPVDLHTTPEDVPQPDQFGHWYRTNYWEFSFRTMEDLEDSLNLLRQDIATLVRSVNSDLRVQEYLEETYE